MRKTFWRAWLAALAFSLLPAWALPQQIASLPPPIATPQDVAYPAGAITLDIDATDTGHHIFRVHEEVPVAGGQSVTLLYPRWLPGSHSPGGPIFQMAGLEVRVGVTPHGCAHQLANRSLGELLIVGFRHSIERGQIRKGRGY